AYHFVPHWAVHCITKCRIRCSSLLSILNTCGGGRALNRSLRMAVETSRPSSRRYPWYDSGWLSRFKNAKELIARIRPEKHSEFVRTFESLRTRPDFQIRHLDHVFDDAVIDKIKQSIRTLKLTELERHEILGFGRFVVHDHPYFTELQRTTVD